MRAGVATLAVTLAGCNGISASIGEMPDFETRARAEMQSSAGVSVGVEILSDIEIRTEFGQGLLDYDIRPVWVVVQNNTSNEYLFSTAAFDPDYLSPGEIAWRTRDAAAGGYESERAKLEERQFPLLVRGHSTASGFIFSEILPGAKVFSVVLHGEVDTLRFGFGKLTPGFRADFFEVDIEGLYPALEVAELDVDALQSYIEKLPGSVLGPDEKSDADPLNLVIVGNGKAILQSFAERDWDLTETASTASALRTAASAIFGSRYKTSPVSPLYLFGRRHDAALQKARESVNERNHLRLWRAPVTFEGENVWVGQISRDIGVKFTAKTFVTHKIDLDVDEARNYLLFDLIETGWYPRFAFASGVGAASLENPRFNYTDDPYVTDGYRLVLFHGGEKGSADDALRLDWEDPLISPR